MESLYLPILIAAVVALFAWGIVAVFSGGSDDKKKKLQERLTAEASEQQNSRSALPLSITLQMEAGGVTAMLIKMAPFQALYRRLVQAWPEMTLATFLGISGVAGLGAFVVTMAVVGLLSVAGPAGAVGFYLPFFALGQKRSRRQNAMTVQIPDALDYLSRVIKAGHSFSTGIQMMSEELPQPLGGEFRRCYDQHSLGQPM